MNRVSLSGSELSIQEVWAWYQHQAELSNSSKREILAQLGENAKVPETFFGMSVEEVEEFFAELDHLAMFDLLAAAEAAIRIDYLNRVYERGKNDLSRQLRALHAKCEGRERLEEDLLEAYKAHGSAAAKHAIGAFCGALNVRHWLAHGRYWTPKFGRAYHPSDVYDIANALLTSLGVES